MSSSSSLEFGDSRSPTRDRDRKSEAGSHFFAGSIAGSVAALVFQPFDVIKTRMITSTHPHHRRFLKSTFTILQEHGMSGFWRGSVATTLRVLPGAGIYFSTLNTLTQLYQTDPSREQKNRISTPPSSISSPSQLPESVALVIGFCSRALSAALTCPLLVIKTRMENDRSHTSISGMSRRLMQENGIRAFFSGLTPSLMRDAPYSGIYLAFYSFSKRVLVGASESVSFVIDRIQPESGTVAESDQKSSSARGQLPPSSSPTHFFLFTTVPAGFAGICASIVTQPFDVIRTRVQVGHVARASSFANSFVQYRVVARQLVRVEGHGWASLFSGLIPRMLKRSSSAALTWSIYEMLLASELFPSLR